MPMEFMRLTETPTVETTYFTGLQLVCSWLRYHGILFLKFPIMVKTKSGEITGETWSFVVHNLARMTLESIRNRMNNINIYT